MTAPVVTTALVGVWTKVATNVTDVSLHPLNHQAKYSWTYRDTGAPAPTLENEKVQFGEEGLVLQSASAMDVYVWVNETTYVPISATVRVDVGLNVTYLIDG